jgi:hypothetical protein
VERALERLQKSGVAGRFIDQIGRAILKNYRHLEKKRQKDILFERNLSKEI